MRIEGLELKNIGVFEDVKMEFPKCPDGQAEIHIFTGVNGSGKSTILKALACGFEKADYTGSFAGIIKDDNAFWKYCHSENRYSSQGKIIIEDGESIKIKYANVANIKLSRGSEDIGYFGDFLGKDIGQIVDYDGSFVAFAYSGYRMIDNYKITNYNHEIIENPFYQALKFIKDPNPYNSLSDWVKTAIYKRSYAKVNHLEGKEVTYSDTIDKIEKTLSEIIGFEISFTLDSSLENAVIKYQNQELGFDVLPDGLKSLFSWLIDLFSKLDKVTYDFESVFDRRIILFLDEIENHLHIKWQRRVLPIVQKLLPNAQIFVTTHSPFVVNSIDDAWVHRLQLDEATKTATIAPPQGTSTGNSYITELMKTFEVYEEYGIPVSEKLQEFHQMKNHILEGKNGNTKEFLALAKDLADVSPSLNNDIQIQLRKLSKQTSKEFTIHD